MYNNYFYMEIYYSYIHFCIILFVNKLLQKFINAVHPDIFLHIKRSRFKLSRTK